MNKFKIGKKSFLNWGFLSVLSILLCFLLTGCYCFLDGSTDGFTIDGVYDGGTTTSIGTCDMGTLNSWMSSYTGDSYDTLPDSGCLRFSIVGTCFPDTASTGYARFDFVSPSPTGWSLSNNGNDFDGFSFYFKTNLPNIYVQCIVELTLTDSSITYYATGFYPVTPYDPWANFTLTSLAGVADIAAINEVRVRVFVANSTISLYSGPEAIVMLDTIQPLYN